MAPSETKKRLALAIVDFLSSSLKDGTLSADDAESIEIAQSCIADTFKVDPSNQEAVQEALGGQSLVSIYSVYEKLKGRTTASTTGSSSANEGRPATPAAPKDSSPKPSAATAESDQLKSEGNAAMSRKDYPSAISKYTDALKISPGNPIYLSNRAAAYSASGDHAKAAQDAEEASVSDPKYPKAWSRLGLARFALGDAKGAAEAYQKGIEAEGNGGSDAMRKGLETSKKRIEEMEKAENEPPSEAVDDTSGSAPRGGAGGPGGMPDLSALAGMLGGGGGGGGGGGMPDLGSIMNNPMFASMAQNLMSNPEMMGNLMNNPRLREMASQFGGGGGAGGQGGQGGGMPDMASLMNDPSIAEMARNLMGGGAGRGAGGGTQ